MAKVIIVNVPGPQGQTGPQGPQGPAGSPGDFDPSALTTTSSFNSFTSSYKADSSSFDFRINNIVVGPVDLSGYTTTSSFHTFTSSYKQDSASFASSLSNVTFDTSSLVNTSSFYSFTSSYKLDSASFVVGINNLTNLTSSYVTNSQTSSFIKSNQTGSFVTTSSFNDFTSSYKIDSSSFNNRISSLVAATSSYTLNSLTGSFLTTSSFYSFTASYNTGSFSGSLFGTSSWAYSASRALTASYADNVVLPAGGTGHIQLSDGASGFQSSTNFVYDVNRNSLYQGDSNNALANYTHAEGYSTTAGIRGDYGTITNGNVTMSGSYVPTLSYVLVVSGGALYKKNIDLNISFTVNPTEFVLVDTSFSTEPNVYIGIGSGDYEIGSYSHTEGYGTIAVGSASHAAGLNTIALGNYQSVVGQYNRRDNATDLFIVGGGSSDVNRKDVFTVSTSSIMMSGSVIVNGSLNVSLGLTGSLFGTSSWAQSSSQALTASYISPTFISASAAASGFGSGGGGGVSPSLAIAYAIALG